MGYRIYHNPRCRKSRETLKLLREHGIEPEIVEYLKHPPSEAELEHLLGLLGLEPEELMRKGEPEYRELVRGRDLDRQAMIRIMVQHPRLIERPIVVADDTRAVLGRPPENVLELIDG